ncbi:uncharacterized protein LOC105838207 isoform X1 [Monomorium pharaonis]|uniref:uncharacterized protein LOC105838207 isoform X1 n=1 Tax=Monomorium pharaonis TaxID=307658 RepID=UPI0017471377|nr:uncharacterized protein LOC105838207 isoform X1 [Monomorium pharaonis]
MKIYVCAILLLVCGLTNAEPATQIRGKCLFWDKLYDVGAYTFNPCMRMICDLNGQISFESCPTINCNPGMETIGFKGEDNSKPYPQCCPQPICKPSKNVIYYEDPHAFSEIQYKHN